MTATLEFPVPPAGGLRTLISDTIVFTNRNIAHIKEIPEKLLDVTVQPLMFVLLFAFVFGGAIAVPGGSYREYLIGGILVQTIAFGLAGPAGSINLDLSEGVIDRFLSLPTSRTAYLLGHFVAEMAGLIVAIAILSLTGLGVGWRIHTGIGDVLAAYALLLLFASAMVSIGTLIGLMVRSSDSVMGVVFIVIFPLTFLSNAFVPIGTLPSPLETIAAYNPVSVIVAAVRQLFGNPGAPVGNSAWPLEHAVPVALAWCLVLLLVSAPMVVARFHQRTVN